MAWCDTPLEVFAFIVFCWIFGLGLAGYFEVRDDD